MANFRPSILGIIGAALGFIAIALPWWTLTASKSSTSAIESTYYLFRIFTSGPGISQSNPGYWFGWVTLALLMMGSSLMLAGSFIVAKRRVLLIVGGLLALSAVILFPVALHMQFVNGISNSDLTNYVAAGGSSLGADMMKHLPWLLYSGSYRDASYAMYLSFGYWIAIVSSAIMLIAAAKSNTFDEQVKMLMAQPQ